MSSDNTKVVELSDVIAGLRKELTEAQKKAEGENLLFNINHIDVELEVSIMKKHTVSAEIEAAADSGEGLIKYVLGKISGKIKIAGEDGYEEVARQKLTLNLNPETADGGSSKINNER